MLYIDSMKVVDAKENSPLERNIVQSTNGMLPKRKTYSVAGLAIVEARVGAVVAW